MRMRHVSIDSRRIRKGEVFVAIKGENFDGHDFIEEAVAKGAAGVVVNSDVGAQNFASLRKRKIPFAKVADTVKELGNIAGRHRYTGWFSEVPRSCRLVGPP